MSRQISNQNRFINHDNHSGISGYSKKIALFAATLSVLSFLSLPALSDNHKASGENINRYEKFERGDEKKNHKRMRRLVNTLDLTESQIELLKLTTKAPSEDREQMHELRNQLKELTHSSAYSEQDAEEIIEQMMALRESEMIAKANANNAFYISLSEEQKASFNTLQEKRNKRSRF